MKQTVEQRYIVEKSMKTDVIPKEKNKMFSKTDEQKDVLKTFSNMKTALLEAHQAVRQLQVKSPNNEQLQLANTRLNTVTQLMHEIKIATPETMFNLSQGQKQQFKQLDYQIEQAAGTLNSLQQTLSTY